MAESNASIATPRNGSEGAAEPAGNASPSFRAAVSTGRGIHAGDPRTAHS